MIISEVVTLGIYAFSMVFLPEYFGAFVFHLPVRRPPLKLPVILFPFFFSLHFSCGKRVTSVDHQDHQESHRT